MNPNELSIWTVYDRPLDFPGHFVVRRHFVVDGEQGADPMPYLASSLEEARGHVPDGLFRMPRDSADDPVIVETWF